MLDRITVTVSGTNLTIANQTSGAPIFAAVVDNVRNGTFHASNLPSLPTRPVAPANLATVGGSGQVTLTWDAVGNATSYNLYYSTSAGLTTVGATKQANVTSPYVLTGLASGSTYYFMVTALNGAGESIASTVASATTAAAQPIVVAPAAPASLIAAGGTNQVSVSWGAVASATSYNVYYSTSNGVTKNTGTKIANATSPMVQTGLAAGTTYYYVVTAVNSAGESAASVQVAATTLPAVPVPTAPAAPTSVSVSGGANQATISWAAVNGASTYNLYWSTVAGVNKTNGTKVAGVTSPYVKTGLAAGTTYYFIVTAVNNAGESAASTQVSATTSPAQPALPAAPAGITATGGASQVSLSWSPVSGASSYNLYWSTTTGVTKTNGTKIANAVSPYIQTGLAAGSTYYYVVTAVNSAGEGPASAQASAATSAPALACGSCHTAPPSTGKHTFHIGEGYDCAVCHGSGYSSTTVNAATHMNNVINLQTTIGWNATSRNCTNSCHGRKNW
jgi:fibronectin type 3 domain-containing protein